MVGCLEGRGYVGLRRGDEVAAATELGGFWKGKIPVGTPGVIDEVDDSDAGPVFTVTFTIVQDDLLTPHQTTATGLGEAEISSQ
jgi:hypothetical protein